MNIIIPIANTINSMPDHTPALKIPPIASQLLKLTANKISAKIFKKYFFILYNFKPAFLNPLLLLHL
jgi:hypothetical protein